MKRRGNYRFLEKFSYYLPGVGGMFALLAWLLVGALLGSLLVMLMGATMGAGAAAEYGTLLSYPVMFIPPMLYASIKSSSSCMTEDGYKLDSKHFAPVGAILCVLMAIVGTLAMGFWTDGIVALLPPMPPMIKEALQSLTNGSIWVSFIAACIFAPVCEEWLCRGLVLRGLLLKARLKPWVAIVVSALFFAFIHLNPWQAIPAFLLGCLFGYVYYKTGSLRLTMLMHFANNALALIIGHIDAVKDAENWIDIMPAESYAVIAAACFLLTVLVVLAFRKLTLEKPEGNIDKIGSLFNSDEV